ncbi:MAG: hypothetical protein OHK0019_36210 [Saprospiraceae bacterium]
MKKIASFFIFLSFSLSQTIAQNPGCDGSRYKDDVFTTVKKTTIQYASNTNQINEPVPLSMDVYEPEGDNISARPVVVLAHGGSFVFGDKSAMGDYCRLLAKKGYVAASIQYRLYPIFQLGFPDSIEVFDQAVRAISDMKAAVRHFRQDAATTNQFRADVNNIFIGGYSAGAVAALHAGYLDSTDVLPAFLQTALDANGGLNGNTGSAANQTYSSSAKAIVNMSGGLYRSNWVNGPGGLPLVSIHGTADATVPFYSGLAAGIAYLQGSGLIHPDAEAAGLLNNLHVVPGGGHTDIYEQVQYKPHRDTFWVNVTTMLESLVCQTVSAEEPLEWDFNWAVFPNPVREGSFTLQFPEAVQQVALNLYDLTGKTVFQANNIQNRSAIRLNEIPAGTYSVQIFDVNNPVHLFAAKKLIIGE